MRDACLINHWLHSKAALKYAKQRSYADFGMFFVNKWLCKHKRRNMPARSLHPPSARSSETAIAYVHLFIHPIFLLFPHESFSLLLAATHVSLSFHELNLFVEMASCVVKLFYEFSAHHDDYFIQLRFAFEKYFFSECVYVYKQCVSELACFLQKHFICGFPLLLSFLFFEIQTMIAIKAHIWFYCWIIMTEFNFKIENIKRKRARLMRQSVNAVLNEWIFIVEK